MDNLLIIDEDLVNLALMIEATQKFVGKNKLNIVDSSSNLQDILSDIKLLKMLHQEMLGLKQMPIKNGFLTKKQASKDLVMDIIRTLQNKQNSLVANLNKKLDGCYMVMKKYYSLLIKENVTSLDVLQFKYGDKIPDFVLHGGYEKAASDVIRANSTKIKTGNTYRVLTGVVDDEKQYRNFSFVEAGLFVHEMNVDKMVSNVNKSLLSSDSAMDINHEYKNLVQRKIDEYQEKINYYQVSYPNAKLGSLYRILNELKNFVEDKYSFDKSILMFDRIIDVLNKNMKSNEKFELITKLNKEKESFVSAVKDIDEKIVSLDNSFNEECNNIEKNEEKVVVKESKDEVKKELQELRKDLVEESLKKEAVVKEFSDSQIDLYRRYQSYRDVMDKFMERKGQYDNLEYFYKDIVKAFYGLGLGTTYEEIVGNIQNMREQLDVTKIIQGIIEEVKLEFTSVEEMNQEVSNGLTSYEERIIGRLVAFRNSDMPNILKEEIDYYISRYQKLESSISFIVKNQKSYAKEVYDKIINDNRMIYYANTKILEEVGLYNEVYNGQRL